MSLKYSYSMKEYLPGVQLLLEQIWAFCVYIHWRQHELCFESHQIVWACKPVSYIWFAYQDMTDLLLSVAAYLTTEYPALLAFWNSRWICQYHGDFLQLNIPMLLSNCLKRHSQNDSSSVRLISLYAVELFNAIIWYSHYCTSVLFTRSYVLEISLVAVQ